MKADAILHAMEQRTLAGETNLTPNYMAYNLAIRGKTIRKN